MSLIADEKNIRTVIVDGQEVYEVQYNGSPMWAKPFGLTVYKGTGVADVIVTRLSSKEPSASIGRLPNTSGYGNMLSYKVYYGDEFEIEATASSGYRIISDEVQYLTITEDTTVYIEAESTTLSPPEIWLEREGHEAPGWIVSVNYRNNNRVPVEVHGSVNFTKNRTDGGTWSMSRPLDGDSFDWFSLDEESSTTIEYNSKTIASGTWRDAYCISIYAHFSADGYSDSEDAYFRYDNDGYDPDAGVVETTTTTTPAPMSLGVYDVVAQDGDWALLAVAKPYKTLRCASNEHFVDKVTGEDAGQEIILYKHSYDENGDLLPEDKVIFDDESRYELVKEDDESAE